MEQSPANINVDLDGLRMFAELLRSDTELGLKPGASRANQETQQGVRFGLSSPGGEVAASRELFAAVLERAEQNLARKVRAAEILTAAIEQILANYTEGDQIAARHNAVVQQALSDAIAAAEAVARSAPPHMGGHQA